MKWEDLRRSQNVEDRRGQSSRRMPTGGGYRRSSGGGLNLLLYLLMSRGPGKWLILGIILLMLVFGGGGLGNLVPDTSQPADTTEQVQQPTHRTSQSQTEDQLYQFASSVLASTEDFWTQAFRQAGEQYVPPKLVIYRDGVQTSGCGFGSSQAGPFYCPGDQKVYIDLSFANELANRYGAAGDFAFAYVIAHEVGHHVQNLRGTMAYQRQLSRGQSKSTQNELSVRLELQADYLAGVWARYADEQGLLEMGDLDEALAAATAVGDDTLQEQAYGRVVPDSFTHGSAQQRREWFQHGYEQANFAYGDQLFEFSR